MTLTAPTPLNENLAAILDADIPFLLAAALLFLAFAIGHTTGRVEARVHAAERRASQARHPSARPQPIAERPLRAMTGAEWDDWDRRFSEAFRGTRLLVPRFSPEGVSLKPLAETMLKHEKRLVCGQPARTSLGTVRCLAQPGHPGGC